MQIKKSLSAALVTLAAASGMVLTAPAAQAADSCAPMGPGGWKCSHTVKSGHLISILFYGDTREMTGWDSQHYYTHLDRSLDGGKTWEGPLVTGQGWSGKAPPPELQLARVLQRQRALPLHGLALIDVVGRHRRPTAS